MIERLRAPLAWSAYIAVPAAGWGWLDGIPIGAWEAAALALVWWAWAVSKPLPAWRLVVVLAVVKVAAAGVLVDRGFTARYFANDAWTAPVERSAEFHTRDFTRRDDRLRFGQPGGPDLPLHFFNDVRFNHFLPTHPRRDRLAYSIEWQGYFDQGDRQVTHLYLEAGDGIAGELAVDGNTVIRLQDPLPRDQPVMLEPGWHLVVVRLKAPYGASRRFEAGAVINGKKQPFDASHIAVRPAGSLRIAADRFVRWMSLLADGAMLAWLALVVATASWDALRNGRVRQLLWIAAIAEAVSYAWRHAGGLVILTGGDDWLAYESFSRAIALGDWIGAGQSGPYYYQPFYSYFLALTHLVFGDGLAGALFVQRILLAATAGWAARIAADLFGARAGWIALVGGGIFLYLKVGAWSDRLLSEMIFLPLAVAWVALLTTSAIKGMSMRGAIAAGVVGGITTLTRSTLLLAWPPVLLLWRASLRARRLRLVGALLITMCAVVATATVRNRVVSDRFVLVASSLGVNLYLGNTPREPLEPEPADRTRLYDRLGLEGYVRTVAEFAAQRPDEFRDGLINKALYTVGLFKRSQLPGADNMGTSRLYVGIWILAAAGIVRLVVTPAAIRAPIPAAWMGLVVALTHFAVMVIVIPFGYGDRYVLPLYPFLIPYAAFAIDAVPALFRRTVAGTPAVWASVRRRAVLLTGRAASPLSHAARVLRHHPRTWVYLAYTATVLHWVPWRPAPGQIDLLTALMLPAIAFAIARLARHDRIHAVLGSALWLGAFLRIGVGGSLSAAALRDPLFWGLIGLVALTVSVAVRRWPGAARVSAAIAGGCTMVAVLLSVVPNIESAIRRAGMNAASQSFTSMVGQVGPAAVVCMIGMMIQALLTNAARGQVSGRIVDGVRGALMAGLIGIAAGIVPATGPDARLAVATLALLLGLVEARATKDAHAVMNPRAAATISSS